MKTNQLKLPLLFILWLIPPTVMAQYSSATIVNNGDPRTELDIVIVGDGYTAGQLTQFRADAQNLQQFIFSEEPFKEYKRYFNVHVIDVASVQSGADHPNAPGDGSCGYYPDFYHTPMPGTCVNTALDSSYGTGSLPHFMSLNYTKLNNIVVGTLPSTKRDLVLVIVNDLEYGGAGSSFYAMSSLNSGYWTLMTHEIGHTLAFLGDEWTAPPASTGCNQYGWKPENIETQINVYPFGPYGPPSTAYVKWGVWIDPNTPIITNGDFNPQYQNAVPGVFQGALGSCLDHYRPTWLSKMRQNNRPWEQINSEQLVKRFYDFMSLPNASQPVPENITVQQGQVEKFGASLPLPLTHSLIIDWYIDGSSVPSGSGQFFTLKQLCSW
ncbi:MAG TPA: M64 family metallopeptidase [Pyrinomonadaceae bacterium]|nr:M64 family metallopeptidase [Pyrinomonadaceae bacterium]